MTRETRIIQQKVAQDICTPEVRAQRAKFAKEIIEDGQNPEFTRARGITATAVDAAGNETGRVEQHESLKKTAEAYGVSV